MAGYGSSEIVVTFSPLTVGDFQTIKVRARYKDFGGGGEVLLRFKQCSVFFFVFVCIFFIRHAFVFLRQLDDSTK